MIAGVTRRQLLAISGTAIAGMGRRETAAEHPKPIRQNRLLRQDDRRLTFAVLEKHWKRIKPFVDQYSTARGIPIDARPLEYDELYLQVSLALTQRADTFDVVSLSDTWIPQFATFLAPIVLGDALLDGLAPVAESVARYPAEAEPCGLPWVGDVQFFAVWPDWLSAEALHPPVTWDEMYDAALHIASGLDEGVARAGFAISTLSSEELVNSFLPILRGFGKELIDAETSIPQLDTLEALAAMQIFEQLVPLSPVESAATGELTNAERFSLGDIAMMSNYWATDWLAAATAVEPLATELLATPQPAEPGIGRVCMPDIWVAGIPDGTLMSTEAHAFVEWLTLATTQEAFAVVGLPTVRTDLAPGGELRSLDALLTDVEHLLEESRIRPRTPYYPQLSRLLGDALARLLAGDISGTEALRGANVAMREFLSREGVLLS